MRISRRDSLEIFALCIANVAMVWSLEAQQIWVARFIKDGILTSARAGWLASGELLMTALGSLVISLWGRYAKPRLIVVSTAVVALIANLASMAESVAVFVPSRLLCGAVVGMLTAIVVGLAVRRDNAQRVLALMNIFMVLIGGVFWRLSPPLLDRFGIAGVFGALAGLCLMIALVGHFGIAGSQPIGARLKRSLDVPSTGVAPYLGCTALAINAAGMVAFGTYLVVIAKKLGFEFADFGRALSVAQPFALLGPLAAHILGERLGLLRPPIIALAGIAVCLFVAISAPSLVVFTVTVAAMGALSLFYSPYAITLVDRIDSSGRFASATPMFILIGNALGPAMGGMIIGTFSLVGISIVAALCISVGIMLLVTGAHIARFHIRTDSGRVASLES